MTALRAIANARIPGRADPVDLVLEGDRVDRVAPAGGPGGPGVLDAAGRAVLPALTDAHVHLDKAYLLEAVEAELAAEGAELTADLGEAIATVARLRPRLGEAVEAGAQRAVDTLTAHGTLAARAMVELDPAVGLDLLDLHRRLIERNSDRIGLQLVAFPQRGLELGGMPELLKAAMAAGADVVGGCPYVDDDPAAHLDTVFALAEAHDAPVDLHLDFDDDPGASQIDLVVERTRASGMAGKVAIGHVTTLAAMDPDRVDAAFAALAEAGIALAVMPATDLYLAGRPRSASGGFATRSVAPVLRAARAGVRIAITNNNLCNPFAPYGNGSQMQAAWLAGIVFRAVSAADRRLLAEAITTGPAAILGLEPAGPAPGLRADLVVVEAAGAEAAVAQAAPTAAVVRGGKLLYEASAPPRWRSQQSEKPRA